MEMIARRLICSNSFNCVLNLLNCRYILLSLIIAMAAILRLFDIQVNCAEQYF